MGREWRKGCLREFHVRKRCYTPLTLHRRVQELLQVKLLATLRPVTDMFFIPSWSNIMIEAKLVYIFR
jgi:hypothetical protein